MDPGGPSYATIELSASDALGNTSDAVCTTLPVLLGSRALNKIDFGGNFRAEVFASSAGAEVSFQGVQQASQLNRFITAERLRDGYTTTLSARTLDGRVFSVFISSGCSE